MVEIIEKRPGPLRIKFNPKRTLINLSEVDYQFIEKRHVRLSLIEINSSLTQSDKV